jgi:hypothetical protein
VTVELPPARKPYVDTNFSDSCIYEDFTIGVYHPRQLHADERYLIGILTPKGRRDQSKYMLKAQRMYRYCDGHQICVGPFPEENSRGHETLISGKRGLAPECRKWMDVGPSRKCGGVPDIR